MKADNNEKTQYQKYFSSDEHQILRQTVRTFVNKQIIPYIDEWEEAGEFPREMYRKVISFCERVDTNINLLEQIEYNSSSGNVSYTSRFQKGYHKEIIFIDLV